MEKPQYNNLIGLDRKIDSVWESPDQATPKFIINSRVKQRVSLNFACRGIEHAEEIFTKTYRF
ncbi:MAG: hypothetical protein EPN22_15420 [Nitrospirae bacterium]|nr:MAG: hypothetical protein EPN22_15420 [Nitrospirota bacterium]